MTRRDFEQEGNSTFWPKTALGRLELVFKLIAIFSALFALYQYFDNKQETRYLDNKQETDSRKKQTNEQLNIFNSEGLKHARSRLKKTWNDYEEIFRYINGKKIKNPEEDKEIRIKLLPIILQRKLEPDIDLLVDFYENLQVCVQNHMCDEKLSRDYFCDYADDFYRLHESWIELQRHAIRDYGSKLQKFVRSECDTKI